MPETKTPADFLHDGVLNYGVIVGRFVFNNTRKIVYAVTDLLHIGPSDVMMIYQISKLNYQRLLGMSLPDRIPQPPIPTSVTEPCRRRFLCGESALCERNAFTILQADRSLVEDAAQDRSADQRKTGFGLFRSYRSDDPARPISSEDHQAGWVLIKAGKLKTLSEGMGYHLYRRPDGKIVCETLCGERVIADSMLDLQRMPPDKLESLIYSCEMSRAR